MILEEVKRGETDRLEFKREMPMHDKRYLKTVVAFANGLGGSVAFGIDDKTLDVVGVPDGELRKMEDGLASAISSACAPAIVPSFSRETIGGKTVLVVFHKMGMIEKWGTGLPRIFARCAKAGVPAPLITIGGSTVAISFKRRGESITHEGVASVGNVGNPVGNVGNPVGNVIAGDSNLDQVIMRCLRDDAKMSAARIAKIANVTTRTIERAWTRLKAYGRIRRNGGTRGVWEILG